MAVQINPEISGESNNNLVNYTLVSTNATTVIKNSPGVFAGIIVTGAGSAWTATVYDNNAASGTVLVPTTASLTVGGVTTGIPAGVSGIATQTGITIVTAGTTAGTLLVLWK
jgi:hypothetical protein